MVMPRFYESSLVDRLHQFWFTYVLTDNRANIIPENNSSFLYTNECYFFCISFCFNFFNFFFFTPEMCISCILYFSKHFPAYLYFYNYPNDDSKDNCIILT